MLRILLTVTACFCLVAAFSQKPSITWGDEFKLKKGSTDLDIIAADQTGVYLQESHGALKSYFLIGATTRTSASLIKLDKDLRELYSNNFNKELKGKDFYQFFSIQDKLLLIATNYNKRENLMELYAAPIDKNSGEIAGDWVLVTSFDKGKRDGIRLKIDLSADSTNLIVVSSVMEKDKNTYQIQEFDKNVKRLGKIITLSNEFDPKTFQLEDLLFTDTRKIILVGRILQYEEGKRKKSKFLDFEKYAIRMYNDQGGLEQEINTSINGKWLMSTKLVQEKDKDLVLAAFFSNTKKGKTIDGLMVQRIDPVSGKVISTTQKDINNSLLEATALSDNTDTEDETKAERKERERLEKIKDEGEGFSIYMKFRNIFYASDGGLIITAEKFQHYLYTSTSYSSGTGITPGTSTTTTYSVYECGDLMVFKMDASAAISWLKIVPKAQQETMEVGPFESVFSNYFYGIWNRPYYSGFGAMQAGHSVVLFFNDNPKNSGVIQPGQNVKRIFRFNKSECFALRIDEQTGKVTRDHFFSNMDVPTSMPRLGSVIGDHMYIVGKDDRVFGKSKIAVAKITVNQ